MPKYRVSGRVYVETEVDIDEEVEAEDREEAEERAVEKAIEHTNSVIDYDLEVTTLLFKKGD